MAGGGDVSACVEMSAGYYGYRRFNSGKHGIAWDCTGNAVERIWGKDPTVDVTNAVLYIDYLQLSCSSLPVGYYDGSDGELLAGLGVSDISASGAHVGVWDFRDDPLICMTAESTKSICISAPNGFTAGFIKCHWGTA